ncbi:hypothetical protein FBY34_8683 [Streptomyces sp. SLBN-115]|nr:hypothetical protein FBY34_8683 [Streptomyces sp. SLBN-115]
MQPVARERKRLHVEIDSYGLRDASRRAAERHNLPHHSDRIAEVTLRQKALPQGHCRPYGVERPVVGVERVEDRHQIEAFGVQPRRCRDASRETCGATTGHCVPGHGQTYLTGRLPQFESAPPVRCARIDEHPRNDRYRRPLGQGKRNFDMDRGGSYLHLVFGDRP